MREWLTYSLSDFLLFSPRTYYRLLELYNLAIWPAHIAALALGGAILWLMHSRVRWAGRAIPAILGVGWSWVAWGYLLERYATINWAASYLAIGFLVQGLLLVIIGIAQGLSFAPKLDGRAKAGLVAFAFALAIYPLIGPLLGRSWTQTEVFGIAPDPTAIATLGIVLAARGRVRWELLIIPLIWCVISGATLWTMGSADAPGPVLMATLVLVIALVKSSHRAPSRPHGPETVSRARTSSGPAIALAVLTMLSSGSEVRSAAPTTVDEWEGKALVERLRRGGLVLFIRHADTTGMPCDRSFQLGDRAGQRNLSLEGRAQSRQIGQHLRALGIAIPDRVLAGPVFRARDTAEIAFGADQVEVTDSLLADDHAGGRLEWVLSEHRRLFTEPVPPGPNRILVGHRTPAIMVLGPEVGGTAFPEGAGLVLEPGRTKPHLLGILALAPLEGRGFHRC
jgi:phosphohistidine phosphatase SixA